MKRSRTQQCSYMTPFPSKFPFLRPAILETHVCRCTIWIFVVQVPILSSVHILRAFFKSRTLTYQIGIKPFLGESHIAVSRNAYIGKSPILLVLTVRVYSFYFLKEMANRSQELSLLFYFCLMDWLSDVRNAPIYSRGIS